MKLYPVRLPEDQLQKIKDIARNKHLKVSVFMRELIAEALGAYSTIPSMTELARQVERHERELSEIKKALLKKGVLE